MALIDKNVLAAKIKNRIKETESMRSMVDPFWEGQISAFDSVLKILDTLETKEVDLDEEFDKCCKNYIFDDECDVYIAKRFFELGLKRKKGE